MNNIRSNIEFSMDEIARLHDEALASIENGDTTHAGAILSMTGHLFKAMDRDFKKLEKIENTVVEEVEEELEEV